MNTMWYNDVTCNAIYHPAISLNTIKHRNCHRATESGPPPLRFQPQGNRDAPQESKAEGEVVPEVALDDRGDDCSLSGVLEGDTNIMCYLDVFIYI